MLSYASVYHEVTIHHFCLLPPPWHHVSFSRIVTRKIPPITPRWCHEDPTAMVLLSSTPEVRHIDRRLSLIDMFNERFCLVDASNLHGIAYLFCKIQHAKIPPVTSIEDGHLWGLGGGSSTFLSTQALIFCFKTIL